MILFTLQNLSKVHQCKICYKPLLDYVKHCHTPSCILWKSPIKYTVVLQDSIQYTCPTNTVLAKTKSTSWRPCPPKPPGQYHETLSHLWYSSAHADLWYSSTYADLPRKMITKPYMQKARDSWDISPQIFWIFRKILGWEREINSAQLEMENAWLLIPSSWRLLEILSLPIFTIYALLAPS